jgi:hypothetical protein
MSKVKDDDYFVEVTLRMIVRRKDAQAVIALGDKWEDPETERDKVVSAVLDLVQHGLDPHFELIEDVSACARPIDTLDELVGDPDIARNFREQD